MKSRHVALACLTASLLLLSGAGSAQVITEFSAGLGFNARPFGITAGPDGNLWFTDVNDRIGRITPQGVITEFSAGITPGATPINITAGPDGNLWFTENGIDRIGRITPQGVVTEFGAGISAGAQVYGITAGPDGNLWFTEYAGHRIGRISTFGMVTEFSVGITVGAAPYYIVTGADGNLWFTEQHASQIGQITPQGAITEFGAGLTGGVSLGEITAGPDGNLWFAETGANKIGRITTQGVITQFGTGITAGAGPSGVTAGPDGNLWFTEYAGDRIGRITTQGVVTEFSVGIGANAGASGIARGADGNLWFAEYNGQKVGRITSGGVVVTEPFDTVAGSPPCVAGWSCQNLSSPPGGGTGWFQGNRFSAEAGAPNSYIGADYHNVPLGSPGTISNWLITPQMNFSPGGVLIFHSRSDTARTDRLEVRISTNGASLDVGATETSVGDFTTLVFTVNPNLAFGAGACPPVPSNGYPWTWCPIMLTSAQGIPTAGSGRIAFRYYMTDAGALGNNSYYIGIDSFSYFVPAPAPTLLGAVSRKAHGAAGNFDLPLSAVPTSPTTEPRIGPAQSIVFTFNMPVSGAIATITEGAATAAAPAMSGNDVVVDLTAVTDQQYVSIALTNVASIDGAIGASGLVRVGFLLGDVNQSRVVSVADLGLVNAQLAQPVTAANFLKDVNVSGAHTVADKGLTNASLTKALPPP